MAMQFNSSCFSADSSVSLWFLTHRIRLNSKTFNKSQQLIFTCLFAKNNSQKHTMLACQRYCDYDYDRNMIMYVHQ